ncbi:probable C-mannosyltransferase DPY19L1 [Galleria mellonella]|uniref:Probable C-mannosyltransferase DPY19L1 n=1 Tax=Galleria mellonella TaxID=7137 RepID=A0ABM3MTH0_GALME|nr:probable C-mannosyltransferase DPY19L1 [Galleria mellonella]
MEENNDDTKSEPVKRNYSVKLMLKFALIVVLATGLGYTHYRYVSYLFENDRNFSYLSEMEREMSFRTEMGFYYSYYKTIVEERPFVAGISKLMYDRLVEYPKDVNAFNRFNIHPEVLIGSIYRYFEPLLNTTAHRQCHMVDRGEGLAPVESCVGIGQPIIFYLEAIWWLAGLTVAGLFLHATALSESILGGGVAVAQYFANHGECTRVQWAPNERENMAAPLLLLQAWLVSLQLRDRRPRTTFQLQVSIFILNCLCLLFWQFSQFIFLTQTAIFFVMEQLRIIDVKSLCVFLHSHFCGLHMAVLLLQGNDMLKSSLFASFFLVVSAYCLFFSSLRVKVQNRLDLLVEAWLVVLRIAIVVCASFYLKKVISDFLEVQEDSHIWDILYSKFSDYKTFHTLIYTCSEVFDFLPWSSIKNMLHSFLIPFALINILNVCNYWLCNALSASRKREMEDNRVKTEKDSQEDTDDSGIENNAEIIKKEGTDKKVGTVDDQSDAGIDNVVFFLKHLNIDAAIFYNISQMAVYGVMAALVMRLKLLFTTQLCVLSSLLMSTKYYVLPKKYMKYLPLLWVVAVSPLAQDLIDNTSQEMSHIGEFSDIPQEELLEWIKRETGSGAAFAGTMPVLATVMLACRRPIVAHPHYEHYEARERAYAVYKTYGRFTPMELYQELNKLRATYLIIEHKYCYGRSSKGCSFQDIWDVEWPSKRGQPRLCHTLLSEPVDHFYLVFRNDHYAVFRIHDVSVRYMPRSFDT